MEDARAVVTFVAHRFDLGHRFCRQRLDTILFLRAERKPEGTRTLRTIRVTPGEPPPTDHGEHAYRRIVATTRMSS